MPLLCEFKSIKIPQNATGITYDKLFCEDLAGSKVVSITEPYIRRDYQLDNLKRLIEILKQQEGEITINLITTESRGGLNRDYSRNYQIEKLDTLKNCCQQKGVNFSWQFDNSCHVRKISNNQNVLISSDRGLHIYRRPANRGEMENYALKRCEQTEIFYMVPKELPEHNTITYERPPNTSDAVTVDNITVNDVSVKKIRILRKNKHIFPPEVEGERNTFYVLIKHENQVYNARYTNDCTMLRNGQFYARSGVLWLGSYLFKDVVGIEPGSALRLKKEKDDSYTLKKVR